MKTAFLAITTPWRSAVARAWLACAIAAGLVPLHAEARPGAGGRPAGGLARPAGGMARPASGMSRPAASVARPQPQSPRPQAPRPQARPMPKLPQARPQPPGGLAGSGMQRPAASRPGLGGVGARPATPGGPARPAPRPGLQPGGATARPGLGTMRPQPGIATKPAPTPGLSRPSLPSRPTPLPGQVGRPGIGGNRPTALPGDLAQRPGIGGNRPGSRPNRPGIGGNRPGIGDGNNLWNGGNIGSGNWGNNNNNNFNNISVGGGWGLPGYGWGYGGGAGHWTGACVNPHYGGWYNGCWGGNWGYNGGWWAPFAVGAATWGLASTLGSWGWGYGGGYVNPYYQAAPAAIVAASPYDYSQPVVASNFVTNGDLADAGAVQAAAPPSDAEFDEALAAFKRGDYASALAGCDKAVKLAPQDSVIHEVRALALFALGRYPEAAATLNAVLAVAPGMDWTTMSGLYGSVDAYTRHLRMLEDFCRANPDSAPGNFVLAYHYLVGGHAAKAADALRVVVAKQPGDVVAKRLLDALEPPRQTEPGAGEVPKAEGARSPAAEPAAGPETDLVGTWSATSGKDSVELAITEDARFTWKAAPAGRSAVEISGAIETARDAIALVSESSGTMTGTVISQGADAFDFALTGAPANAKPIEFRRLK